MDSLEPRIEKTPPGRKSKVPITWIAINLALGVLTVWVIKYVMTQQAAADTGQSFTAVIQPITDSMLDAWPGVLIGTVYCLVSMAVVRLRRPAQTKEQQTGAWFCYLMAALAGLCIGLNVFADA